MKFLSIICFIALLVCVSGLEFLDVVRYYAGFSKSATVSSPKVPG